MSQANWSRDIEAKTAKATLGSEDGQRRAASSQCISDHRGAEAYTSVGHIARSPLGSATQGNGQVRN